MRSDPVVPEAHAQHCEISELSEESPLASQLSSLTSLSSHLVFTVLCTECGNLASVRLCPDIDEERLVCSGCGCRSAIFTRARPRQLEISGSPRPGLPHRAAAPAPTWRKEAMTMWSSYSSSPYLSAGDFEPGEEKRLTIKAIRSELVGRDRDNKPVAHFEERGVKPLVLNRTNQQKLATLRPLDRGLHWRVCSPACRRDRVRRPAGGGCPRQAGDAAAGRHCSERPGTGATDAVSGRRPR